MKRALPLLSCLVIFSLTSLAGVAAQDRVAVTFKVFPPEYEVFAGGERLNFTPRGDGLRTYALPAGSTRVNLTAPGAAPLGLALDVKAGMTVEAKLEPRQGPLTLLAEAGTGKVPRNLAFSADGKKLFVALQGEPGVEVYDVPSLKKRERLAPTAPGPSGYSDVAVIGNEVWAVQRDGSVHVFDGTTLAFKETFKMLNGGNATLASLGAGKAALADWDNSLVSFLDVAGRKTTSVLTLGGSLRGFASGAGTAYAVIFDRAQVAVLDTATQKVKTTWAVGKAPRPVAVTGSAVFVGDMANATVLILDPNTGKYVNGVGVASNPHQMAVSADRSLVAVASRGRNNPNDYQLAGPEYGKVTVFNAKGDVLASVWGRNQPTGLAFSPDSKYLAFTDLLDDNVELYRIK